MSESIIATKLTRYALLTGALLCLAAPAAANVDEAADEVVIAAAQTTELENGMTTGTGGITVQQNLNASTTGSVAVAGDLTTGKISLGDNFGGNGFGSYVNNTGNNTAINSAMSVNVNFQPTP